MLKVKSYTVVITYLNTLMAAQVEVKFSRMCNANINGCSSWYIARFT